MITAHVLNDQFPLTLQEIKGAARCACSPGYVDMASNAEHDLVVRDIEVLAFSEGVAPRVLRGRRPPDTYGDVPLRICTWLTQAADMACVSAPVNAPM